jgi:tetratricopeptide (TPR) repeat protein
MLHLDYASDAKALFAASDADSLRAVRADPASVDAWLVRADSLRQQGEPTAASAALDRAEDAQPTASTRHRVSVARAWLSIAEGKPHDALARLAPLRPAPLRPVLESPGDDALLPRCAAYLLLGQYGAAIDNCEGVGSLDDWAVNLYLAAAYALEGRVDKARLASGWLVGAVPGFTLDRYQSRFHARMSADAVALERAHLVAGLRQAGVPEK